MCPDSRKRHGGVKSRRGVRYVTHPAVFILARFSTLTSFLHKFTLITYLHISSVNCVVVRLFTLVGAFFPFLKIIKIDLGLTPNHDGRLCPS